MVNIKNIIRKIPGALYLWHIYQTYKMKRLNTEEVFTEIYRNNKWGDKESISGSGSNTTQTIFLVKKLPKLLRDLKISTILDIPCGDFNWMGKIDLNKINYFGADIVKELVLQDTEKFQKKNIHFYNLNLIKDDLPKVDLIICRDCLVHFSFDDIVLALNNICHSKSTYLLTTTFPNRKNKNIITGEWRALNLTRQPINLPKPIKLLNEGCSQEDGLYTDKSLGLWSIKDIAKILNKTRF